MLCCLSCVKVWLHYDLLLLRYCIICKNRGDFHLRFIIKATISCNATILSHMINSITFFHIEINKQDTTIIHISYFLFVNILARKFKGEYFILNRPLNSTQAKVVHKVFKRHGNNDP